MELTDEQIRFINENEVVTFSTSSLDGTPRCIYVCPSMIHYDQIVISDVHMVKSSKNIQNNPRVFITSITSDYSKWLKISGTARYEIDGELFDKIYDLETSRGYKPRAIIVVEGLEIQEVEETD